jgi:NAD-dependent dihydropyrimidine dehydrogenase PreA subunit
VIEVVAAARCIGCDVCVAVCPTNVFDPGPGGGPPVIARQADCQTCFMCEAYCPADALFVAPHACPLPASSPLHDEAYLTVSGLLGGYRNEIGWGRGRIPGAHCAGAAAAAGPRDYRSTRTDQQRTNSEGANSGEQ